MDTTFTTTQKERLSQLGVPDKIIDSNFEDNKERDKNYIKLEKEYSKENRENIQKLLNDQRKTISDITGQLLCDWLTDTEGYTKVSTPIIINSTMLDKMTITADKPLREQVFWVESKKCLRPMLAPNLYVVMRELRRITNEPVKIFEIGSCFRKESQGAQHMNEFTMLNCVNLGGIDDGKQMDELERMAKGAMSAVGIEDYELVKEGSTVYGETLDIVAKDVELASGSYGPHKLDSNWGIFDTWVGIGFGVERIAMTKGGYDSISKVGKSINYINGSTMSV